MKEEDEYIDSIISSAVNSIDVDVSTLNSDWNDLKPLLIKKRKKRFLIFFFLISPFIIYGAYSISGTEWFSGVKSETTNKAEEIKVSDGLYVKKESENLISDRKEYVKTLESNEPNVSGFLANGKVEVKESTESLKEKNRTNKQEQERIKVTETLPHGVSQISLIKEVKRKNKDLIISDYTLRRPLVSLECKINSFIESEHFSQDSVGLIKNNKIHEKSFGILYAKDVITFSKQDKKDKYKLGVNFSIVVKDRLDLIMESNYTQTRFVIIRDGVDPTPPASGGYNSIVPNSPPVISNTNDESTSVNIDYKASHIDFNLGMNWRFVQRRKLNMYANFSPEINFLIREQGLVNYSSKISSSLNLGFGIDYLLGNKVKLFLQPNINYMYLGFKPIENSLIKSYSLEGKTGLKFLF